MEEDWVDSSAARLAQYGHMPPNNLPIEDQVVPLPKARPSEAGGANAMPYMPRMIQPLPNSQAIRDFNYLLLQEALKQRQRPDYPQSPLAWKQWYGYKEGENAVAPGTYSGGRLPEVNSVQEALIGDPPEFQIPDEWHIDLLQGRNKYHDYNRRI